MEMAFHEPAWSCPFRILALYEKVTAIALWGMLSFFLLSEAYLLAQWGPGFREDLPHA